jgi:hypothetical protein
VLTRTDNIPRTPHDALRSKQEARLAPGFIARQGLILALSPPLPPTTNAFPIVKKESIAMTRAERRDLLTAALTHLDAAANLLEEAEEGVLAEETRELNDKVDVVALVEPASLHAV